MLRVRTLYAASAAATAAYYTRYLTESPDDVPGVWTGSQATGLRLSGPVSTEALEAVLSGRDPNTGTLLGRPLADRTLADGRVVRAVAGFDATFSAPKSLSILAALTHDPGYAEAHDVAVAAVAEYIERFGATTRIRTNGGRLHVDTQGLTMAAFRQGTSRLDDPQLHTHLVISAKVQTAEGRWMALDARFLKQHQRALGGLYQSVLRAEVMERFGLRFEPVVNGQAEIVGVPTELLEVFSKRAAQIDTAMTARLADFYTREGRDPTPLERAAIERETAADTRGRKTGIDHTTLHTRWVAEAAAVGITPDRLQTLVREAARDLADTPVPAVRAASVIEELSDRASAWHRMDIVRTICDAGPERAGIGGRRWVQALDHAVAAVTDQCVDLDPGNQTTRRPSDGRSVWIEPTANRLTSQLVLDQEATILDFATGAAAQPARPSDTVERGVLDVAQHAAASAVAGHEQLVVVIGPAGTGKTTMLAAAVTDLHGCGRGVFGVAPTAKAAAVLGRETGMETDTVAKLVHEWTRPDRDPQPRWRLARDTTLVVDEAGMISTPDLARITRLATEHAWRVVLVGDPRQLQAVGRGGLLPEVARIVTPIELDTIHRFTNPWEPAATLQLRRGDAKVLDLYERHGRIHAGPLAEHLDTIAHRWRHAHAAGETVAVTATTNDHAHLINTHLQQARLAAGELDPTVSAIVRDDAETCVGDVVATRRNLRDLCTDAGEMVRNRERWTVTAINPDDGAVTLSKLGQPGTVVVPRDTARDTIELAYAVTEYGNQGDTHPTAIALISPATTTRGLYVAMTRGRHDNTALVVTDTHDPADARDVLEAILAVERGDVPATRQRRDLAHADPTTPAAPSRPQVPSPTPPTVPARPLRPQPAPPVPPVRVARVVVPDWFDTARADLVAEIDRTILRINRVATDAQQRRAAIAAAQRRIERADQQRAPFNAGVIVARLAVDTATTERDQAAQRATAARLGSRRDARAELAVAEQNLAHAQAEFDAAGQAAAPYNDEYYAAVDQQAELERDDRSTAIIDWYQPTTSTVRQLERRLNALDRWHDWAVGEPLSILEIRGLQGDLGRDARHDWLRETPQAKLADTIQHTTPDVGVPPEPVLPEVPQPELHPGLGLI